MTSDKTIDISISKEVAERLLPILKEWLLEYEDLIRKIEENVYPEKFSNSIPRALEFMMSR